MKQINSISAESNFQLLITFEGGIEKQFDLKPYFQYPVFSALRDEKIFKTVVNKNYFIEWENQEVDLSADTLWHEGRSIK